MDESSKTLEELHKQPFAEVDMKGDEAYGNADYKNASFYFLACALDRERGEMHQHTLYRLNPQSLSWIKTGNFAKLCTLLPELGRHLQDKHMNEQRARRLRQARLTREKAFAREPVTHVVDTAKDYPDKHDPDKEKHDSADTMSAGAMSVLTIE